MSLNVLTRLDSRILDVPATDLKDFLDGPTLFDLRRTSANPLFVSVLLHGNETSGWDAIRSYLKAHESAIQSSSLLLFVGNVVAAGQGVRSTDGQADFNRIWGHNESAESGLVDSLMDFVSKAEPWFALDIHNNSGPNPHYSVITDNRPDTLSAARTFSQIAILAEQPQGVLTRRLSEICTSITIETGVPSDPNSAYRAQRFVEQLTENSEVPRTAVDDLVVYRNNVRVTFSEHAMSFSDKDLTLNPRLDSFNFKRLKAGSTFFLNGFGKRRLQAWNEHDVDVTHEYFDTESTGDLLLRDVVLSMYTRDPTIARQDCVCYFLDPVDTCLVAD